MLREKKKQVVENLAEELSRSNIIISTNYQGLTAKQMAELRNAIAKTGARYHVVKNTLTHFAAEKAGKPQILSAIEGPTALAFGYHNGVELAKALSQYIKSTGLPLRVKGGLLENKLLSSEDVIRLANLPPQEVLIAQLTSQLQAPMRNLHNILNSPLQGLLNLLQRRIEIVHAGEVKQSQLEGG